MYKTAKAVSVKKGVAKELESTESDDHFQYISLAPDIEGCRCHESSTLTRQVILQLFFI